MTILMGYKAACVAKPSKYYFFSAAPTVQNSPELKIHIRNVAQDTFVYTTLCLVV